ncbi:sulfatase-like hydrolase/transferase, partial [Opitutaceae bacterium]|nr:sulfatase-like hydrolase/transferase [Opitutaceae bacterium]
TDNGGTWGRNVFNAGLRAGKGSVYDGGHRVPFFVRWPEGGLTGGRDDNSLVAHVDLLPTFVDLLGLDFVPGKPLDGISFADLLRDPTTDWPNRIMMVDTQRLQNLVKYRTYAVLDQEWRLVNGDELYHITEDRAQEHNVIDQYPAVAGRLAQGYERIWQSILDEGAAEKYAYIKVGTAHENPSRINSHDMLTGKHGGIWHQYGAAGASPGSGRWKIEFVEDGDYQISLRRFPRESGLAINDTFPAEPRRIEQQRFAPAGVKDDFTEAYLYVAGIQGSQKIEPDQAEVNFTGFVPAGKYDMEAQLIDTAGILHPSYYLYIEKL